MVKGKFGIRYDHDYDHDCRFQLIYFAENKLELSQINFIVIVIVLYLTSVKLQVNDNTNYKSHSLHNFKSFT